MYGTQTQPDAGTIVCRFENDVKMYGTQTGGEDMTGEQQFENDVKMYGAQTVNLANLSP